MASLTQNLGALDNNQYTNGFSPGAQAVDLRGLGPNHTLVLINGRRIADYPQAEIGVPWSLAQEGMPCRYRAGNC